MKIENSRKADAPGRRAGQTAAPGFAPEFASGSDVVQRAAAASAVSAAPSLDAMLALQAEGFDPQRRSRQVRRGHAALDALDQLARGLLSGLAPSSLRGALDGFRRGSETTGESGLDAIMLEIDTRLAVEQAKLDLVLGRA